MDGNGTSGEPITEQGLTALREEIEELEGPARTTMAARIKVAREEGDRQKEHQKQEIRWSAHDASPIRLACTSGRATTVPDEAAVNR